MAAAYAPAAAVDTVTLHKIGDFLELDLGRLFAWLRAGFRTAVILAVAGAFVGAAFGVLSTAKYTVSSEILIDPANLQVVADDLFQQPGQVDSALLNAGSKLRVLTSRNVLARVVEELRLAEDPEFYDPTPGLGLSTILPGNKEAPNPQLAALTSLSSRVSATADENSFVATLFVTSESSEKSIRISDAIVQAFKEELASGEADGAARTADSLNNRLNELKEDVKVAEERVEAYKRSHNLISTSGELIGSQTIALLNAQVVEAQSRLIAAQSTYDELLAAGVNASTSDTQASTVLSGLRASAGALQQQLNAQSVTYGQRHPTIARLSTELAAVETQLQAEVGRIVAAAKVRVEEARTALAALEQEANDLRTRMFSDNEALVRLRELERDAVSKAAIYEAFLARAREVTEREQIDTTNIRVISTAVPPAARSWPPRTLVVALVGAMGGLFLGLLIATGVGMARDLRAGSGRHPDAAATA
ncbi:MAG TPA: GumC family protein [Devosiaceae bacterium]|nr:GumC family protein [Devosiaceae bacterium]